MEYVADCNCYEAGPKLMIEWIASEGRVEGLLYTIRSHSFGRLGECCAAAAVAVGTEEWLG